MGGSEVMSLRGTKATRARGTGNRRIAACAASIAALCCAAYATAASAYVYEVRPGQLTCLAPQGIIQGTAQVNVPLVETYAPAGSKYWAYVKDEIITRENLVWHQELSSLWWAEPQDGVSAPQVWWVLENGAWHKQGLFGHENLSFSPVEPEWVMIRQWVYDQEWGKWSWALARHGAPGTGFANEYACRPGTE
jgi:hypothetical protein